MAEVSLTGTRPKKKRIFAGRVRTMALAILRDLLSSSNRKSTLIIAVPSAYVHIKRVHSVEGGSVKAATGGNRKRCWEGAGLLATLRNPRRRGVGDFQI